MRSVKISDDLKLFDIHLRGKILYRRPVRERRDSSFKILLFITISALVLLVILLTARLRSIQKENADRTSRQSVAQSLSQLKEQSNSTNETSETSKEDKQINPAKTATSVEITDLSPYLELSGKYVTRENADCTIDFKDGVYASENPGKQQVYYFDKVLIHPDKTIVINVSGDYDYSGAPGQGDITKKVYLSLLLAPPNTTIRKNWQTGDAINDVTTKDKARFAIAYSYDNGKTFNMTPAYQSFATNGYSSDPDQENEIYYYED